MKKIVLLILLIMETTILTAYNLKSLTKEIQESSKPVILYFRKDACVSCMELEQKTFSDKNVKKILKNFTLLKIDVTTLYPKNTTREQENKKMLDNFKLFGTPSMIFFNKNHTQEDEKLMGFINVTKLIAHLNKFVEKKKRIDISTLENKEKEEKKREQTNYNKKQMEYRILANKGHKEAQFLLATTLFENNLDEAIHWLLKSEEQNCTGASALLGLAYFYKQEKKLGMNKIIEAAYNGDISSTSMLVSIYLQGRIVKQNLVEAYFWAYHYSKYVKLPSNQLQELKSLLSKAQVKEVSKLLEKRKNRFKEPLKTICQQSAPI